MLRCCVKVGLMSASQAKEAAEEIPPVEAGQKAGTYLSPADVAAVVAVCWKDPNAAAGARDAAMLMMLAGTGMRREELVALTFAELDLADGKMNLVITKGGKPRVTFLSAPVRVTLERWITIWRPSKEGPLFVPLTRGGRIAGERPLSAHQLWKMVKRRCAQAGLPATITPHDFRRYAVGQMLDHGIDLAIIKRAMGHKRIETTMGYDTRPTEQIRTAVEVIELPALAVTDRRRRTPHESPLKRRSVAQFSAGPSTLRRSVGDNHE